jgi:hypothetical protein
MPNALQKQIEAAAAEFARGVIQAIRRASLDDLQAEAGATPTKRAPERSPKTPEMWRGLPLHRGPGRPPKDSDLTGSRINLIVSYVKSHPGTSGQDARKALGFPKPQWSTYVARAVKAGKLTKKGDRRAMKYWAV